MCETVKLVDICMGLCTKSRNIMHQIRFKLMAKKSCDDWWWTTSCFAGTQWCRGRDQTLHRQCAREVKRRKLDKCSARSFPTPTVQCPAFKWAITRGLVLKLSRRPADLKEASCFPELTNHSRPCRTDFCTKKQTFYWLTTVNFAIWSKNLQFPRDINRGGWPKTKPFGATIATCILYSIVC